MYGGGGIMPDIFVPQDTTGMTSYFRMAASRGLIIRYSFDYTDNNRNTLQKYDTVEKCWDTSRNKTCWRNSLLGLRKRTQTTQQFNVQVKKSV